MGRKPMNTDELADAVHEAVEESPVQPVDMQVNYSEHLGVVVHYRGRKIISAVRSLVDDEAKVRDSEVNDFGEIHLSLTATDD